MTHRRRRRSASPRRRRDSRRGFTLIELMIVTVVVGILTGIAMPRLEAMRLKARAAQVLGEIDVIKVAVANYNANTLLWPPDTWPGETPEVLEPYLPDGFSFQREGYSYDWEMWKLPDGTPKHPGTKVLLGISLHTEDEALAQAVIDLVGPNTVWYTLSTNYTFVMEGL